MTHDTIEELERLEKAVDIVVTIDEYVTALRNAAPALIRMAKEALLARDIIPEWADILNDLDIEINDWRKDYADWCALVSAHDKESEVP